MDHMIKFTSVEPQWCPHYPWIINFGSNSTHGHDICTSREILAFILIGPRNILKIFTRPCQSSPYPGLTNLKVVGDLHIPERQSAIPQKFRDLLVPGKIQVCKKAFWLSVVPWKVITWFKHVLCTGNVTTKESVDFLRNLAGDVQIGNDPNFRIHIF